MNALKACKDQRRTWTVGKTDRNLKKSTTAWSEGMQWHLWIWCTCIVLRSLFPSDVTVLLAYDKAKILHHIELLVSNEQLGMHTPAMETSTSIPSNNENGQEMEASGINHGPDLTGKWLLTYFTLVGVVSSDVSRSSCTTSFTPCCSIFSQSYVYIFKGYLCSQF